MPAELERDDHADAAEPVHHRAVRIAGDDALADRKLGRAAQRHVLADLGDGVGNGVGDGDGAGFCRQDFVDVGTDAERDAGDHLHQTLEQIVAGDEIRLGIHLDDDAFAGADGNADQAFGGDAPGLFCRFGQALFAQPIDRGLEIAVVLAERRLAVHHAGSGLIAELFHHACADVCHRC